MQIQDVMSRSVEVVRPDGTLEEAARKMRQLDVGALPVCDGDRVLGVITDRDIVVRAIAKGSDPRRALVRDAMSDQPSWVFEDQEVSEAAKMMADRQIRRLLVLDRGKKLVGIVSLGDLATGSDEPDTARETLQEVSEPNLPV